LRHLTDGWSWAALPSPATVVDLGGSHGDAAFALAQKYANLHIIVQDLPEIVADSKTRDGVKVEFMVHDFFTEQPVKDADVYFFRWIMHNWTDKYAIEILRALVPALKKGARVLVMDFVMPEPGVLPNDVERQLR
jgi:trans-aconitate methyltransferase